jgi:hypothetical protein
MACGFSSGRHGSWRGPQWRSREELLEDGQKKVAGLFHFLSLHGLWALANYSSFQLCNQGREAVILILKHVRQPWEVVLCLEQKFRGWVEQAHSCSLGVGEALLYFLAPHRPLLSSFLFYYILFYRQLWPSTHLGHLLLELCCMVQYHASSKQLHKHCMFVEWQMEQKPKLHLSCFCFVWTGND